MIRVVRLAVMVYLKKRVEQVPAVTVVPAALLEGSWPTQTPSQGKERGWKLGSDTGRSKLEKDR